MRFLLILALVFLRMPALSGQEKVTEIDLRVRGVGSGTRDSVVEKSFGKPMRIKREKVSAKLSCSTESETFLTRFYPGLEIELIGYGKTPHLHVTSIEVTSSTWVA